MLYLNSKDIQTLGVHWPETIDVIRRTVNVLYSKKFSQPIKPYLLFDDPANRIIAMPAYVGGEAEIAGIKWIASFPKNIEHGMLRAHSVTILNDANTGKPLTTINTALVSGIRTASVSGLMISEFEKARGKKPVQLGIIGYGPIGQLHLSMAATILGDRLQKVCLYDKAGIKTEAIPVEIADKVQVCQSWQECYTDADIFITCTVSSKGYIDLPPKPGSLQLNVSLRDFTTKILDHKPVIFVDNWEEVCRANTDIEVMHKERGLQKEGTQSIEEIVCEGALEKLDADETVMFNPMGMAVFDITIAKFYYELAQKANVGTQLED